ncbi:unnamed protein product [Lampetra planeri]
MEFEGARSAEQREETDLAMPPALEKEHCLRSRLLQALTQIAGIFEPPFNKKRHKFATRRRGESEMPLALHSALMALAKSAYPKMEEVRLDSLVLECMLA